MTRIFNNYNLMNEFRKQSSSLLIVLIVLIVILQNSSGVLSAVQDGMWSDCKYVNINNSNQQVLTCSSIKAWDETTFAFRYEDSVFFTVYYKFFDTKEIQVCDETYVKETLFKRYGISSCYQTFVNNFPKLVNSTLPYLNSTYSITSKSGRSKAVTELAWIMNYCQYCNRADFIEFHTNISTASSVTPFKYVQARDFCNYGNEIPKDNVQAPLVHGQSLLDEDDIYPWICYCGNSDYGFKCDYFSTNFIPFTFKAYPIIAFIVPTLLAIATFICNVIPLAYRNFKKVAHKVKFNLTSYPKAIFEETFTLSWIIIGLIFFYFILLAIENALAFATIGIFEAKTKIGVGFFRALSLLLLISALFSILVMWLNLLLGSMRTSNDSIKVHIGLKVTLGLFYIFIVGLSILPFVYSGLQSSPIRGFTKTFNLTFFTLTAASTIIFTILFILFGAKLYFKLKIANNLSIFQIKFTKFVMFLMVTNAIVLIEIIFIIIEYGASQVVFGLFYRSVNFNTLDLSMCLLASGIIYQMTPNAEFRQIFCPCIKDATLQKYQDYITKKSGRNKKKQEEIEEDSSQSESTPYHLGTSYKLSTGGGGDTLTQPLSQGYQY